MKENRQKQAETIISMTLRDTVFSIVHILLTSDLIFSMDTMAVRALSKAILQTDHQI